jgi:non-ribosomal peptide synthase protein (TIGR01720 family)
MEGHGREAVFEQLDTNETVGWFTSVYPLVLDGALDADLGALINSVKEQYRGVPSRGFGYGALVELCGDATLRTEGERLMASAIEFNYLGQFDQTLSRTTSFRAAAESPGASSSEANRGGAPITINGLVSDQCLTMTCSATREIEVVSLMAALRESLSACVSACMAVLAAADVKREYQVANKYRAELKSKGIEV